MKQFRFIGGEDSIYWGVFEPNQFYDEDFKEPSFPAVIELAETSPKDWEEVTEQEEKQNFKFIGDEDVYPVIKKGEIVPFGFHPKEWGEPVQVLAKTFPNDWEIVKDEPIWKYEPPNQDKPASEMTKFEMAVFMAMQGLMSLPDYASIDISRECIAVAKETFKQLDELK